MRYISWIIAIGFTTFTLLAAPARAQLVINEANTVSADDTIQTDSAKPYEGYDFGVVPYSGNDGAGENPFPSDISAEAGVQTTQLNGWDLADPTGWARVEGNGGDWLELVVTEDHLDIRGWVLYWENDDTDTNGADGADNIIGSHSAERGFIQFTDHAFWSNLRAGTIITLSEQSIVDEVNAAGADTGHDYSLATNPSFNPLTGDWHIHFHVDESLTDAGIATDYFEAYSDAKVDNDDWRAAIFADPSLAAEVEDENNDRNDLGLDTNPNIIGAFVGESADDYGDNTGAGGINSQEVLTLTSTLVNGDLGLGDSADPADYEDTDFSTFGAENLFNTLTEDYLDGVQDFSALRAWLASVVAGDINDDGAIDVLDIVPFSAVLSGNALFSPAADVNGDTAADVQDIAPFVDLVLTSPDTGAVPEPGTLALLGGAALLLVRRR